MSEFSTARAKPAPAKAIRRRSRDLQGNAMRPPLVVDEALLTSSRVGPGPHWKLMERDDLQ
ncbi:MAG: hypothetical protein DMD35_18825 [Gemmatimonadetes bacterium]|nr:MAG: hypothetical protein DMD35_18825 [Gemmatimonadota bacterium]